MHTKMKRLVFAWLLSAVPVAAFAATDTAETVAESKRVAARDVARLLNDSDFVDALSQRLNQAEPRRGGRTIATALRPLLTELEVEGHASPAMQSLRTAEMRALRAKGTATNSRGLFEVRLHVPAGQAMPLRLADLKVAFEPAGEERTRTRLEAFDADGNVHVLDPREEPNSPILVVDVDGREDMRSGIEVMNQVLRDHGMQEQAVVDASVAGGNELTVLKQIVVKDDEEPFTAGDADIYAIESGINTNGDKPLLVIHDMPWLNDSKVTYYPGQPVVFWSNHALGVANLQLMEQDDNVDWVKKALELIASVSRAVGTIEPTSAVVSAIAEAVLAAFPDGVFTNEDDYVDSYYLLERGKAYTNREGARANATATFEPYSLNP
jgi:hypothetical protein